MKDTDNKVFELTDEDLAKVVGGIKKDVPTVTPERGNPSEGINTDDYSTPGVETPCDLLRIPGAVACTIDVNKRTTSYCPTCPFNY